MDNEKIVLNPEDFTQEKSTVWNFPVRGAWATHKPDYRGNFAPQVPRNVILSYSNEGDLVLDPMVGGGTTLIEARLLNRNAIGYDVNQNAVNITSVVCQELCKISRGWVSVAGTAMFLKLRLRTTA